MRARLSFVIPAYNAQKYLAETVESCLRQTYAGIEVVIVNDGSTDTTQDIINHYVKSDDRVKGIIVSPNKGRSMARNAGMEAAVGEIIMALDSDDVNTDSRAAITKNYFKKYPSIDILYGDFQIIDQLSDIKGKILGKPFDWERLKEDKFTYIGHSTMAFRRSVAEKVQYSDGDYSKHAIDDWKFQVDAYKAGFKFGYTPRTLCQYRHYYNKPRDEKKILEIKEKCLA